MKDLFKGEIKPEKVLYFSVVLLVVIYTIRKFSEFIAGGFTDNLAVDTKEVRDPSEVALLAKRMLAFFEEDNFFDKFDPFREDEFKDFIAEANGYTDDELKLLTNIFNKSAKEGSLHDRVRNYYLLIFNDTDRDILVERLERLGAV